MTRRRLTETVSRQIARRTLDGHWNFMRRLARQGVVHVCIWNKYGHKEQRNEYRHGLIDGLELMDFVRQHRPWFGYGAFDRSRNTFPMWLTPRGRSALRTCADRPQMILGGLVEPGYQVMPIDFHRRLNEQRSRVRIRAGLSRASYIRPLTQKIEEAPSNSRRTAKRRRKA
jgi:hypothetical protein